MAGLKYPYTCDEIDKQIGAARGELISAMADNFKMFGLKNTSFRDAQEAGEVLFSALSDVFENTRKSNEDIREAANNQIQALEDQITELRAALFIAEQKNKKEKNEA